MNNISAKRKLLAIPREELLAKISELQEEADIEAAAYNRSRNSVMEAYFSGIKDGLRKLREEVHGSKDMFIDLREIKKVIPINDDPSN